MKTAASRAPLTLVTGDRQLSSWSLRAWILLKHLGLEFEEVRLRLDTEEFRHRIGAHSPTRRVPVLIDGALTVWESLAICEYANELAGGIAWPEAPEARALARAISTEMHAGFDALRQQWPMQAASSLRVMLDTAGQVDLDRIDMLWQEALDRSNRTGPWLFGHYSIADAMYAPVVLRFNTYGAALSPASSSYLTTALADPWLQEWIADAGTEVGQVT